MQPDSRRLDAGVRDERDTADVKPGQDDIENHKERLAHIRRLLGQRRADEAAAACLSLASDRPGTPEPLLLLGKARQQQGRFDHMLRASQQALAIAPGHPAARLQFTEACIFNGQHDIAVDELAALEGAADGNRDLLQRIGEYYAHLGRHTDASRCYERAVALAPDDPRARYNLAAAQIALGLLDDAEKNFTSVIERNPRDYDAWQNRSTLRKQTATDNHITALGKLLESGDAAAEVPLCYALAKEYEDLGEYETSFRFLKRGADHRRRMMAYRVDGDIAVMERIAQLFDERFAASTPPAESRRGPLFVTGLPRSGTTLVDRILSSHSRIDSLGEINDFALTLTRLAGTSDKAELLDASARLDMDALGEAYVTSARNYGSRAELFIDKTPANWLYLGLIARALPSAVVIHVRRHPLDSCFAMYRTLFRMGYPFSYDLDDLARYYVAYHHLMEHWRRTFPGAFLEVGYEQLVNEQEAVSRRLVARCGLDWEDTCLAFERNTAPVATASAAQVRRPIYRDALARWRHYERQLEPLIRKLGDAGIEL